MALPTSGALSLNAIHVEAGGTSGTTCSFNDSDIRGLTAASGKTINSTLGTQIDFNNFYGASSVPSATITNGYYHFAVFGMNFRYRGFSSQLAFIGDSISPSTPTFTGIANGNVLSDAFVYSAVHANPQFRRVEIYFNDTNTVSNTNSSAFTSVTIGSTTLNRSAATFTYANTYYRWYWTFSDGIVNDNTSAIAPFGAPSTTTTISFS